MATQFSLVCATLLAVKTRSKFFRSFAKILRYSHFLYFSNLKPSRSNNDCRFFFFIRNTSGRCRCFRKTVEKFSNINKNFWVKVWCPFSSSVALLNDIYPLTRNKLLIKQRKQFLNLAGCFSEENHSQL